MENPPLTPFDRLMQQVSNLPLWAKQVLYAMLQQELKASLSQSTLQSFVPEHLLQLWIPEINRQSMAELEKRQETLPTPLQRVLQMTRHRKTVAAMAVLNRWSLAQCSEVLTLGLEKDLLIAPPSATILATAHYLAGRTRLGEYLVQISRLTVEQLDQALRTQKTIQDTMGERVGIANVLINLGYIKKEDSESILFLKEESKKPFPAEIFASEGPQTSGSEEGNSAAQARMHQLETKLQQAIQHIRKLESLLNKPSPPSP
jgi:hypothetical protein